MKMAADLLKAKMTSGGSFVALKAHTERYVAAEGNYYDGNYTYIHQLQQ
jgi:hypothetical protein